jgi:hypothetical protein
MEECGPCPAFASFSLAFALQLKKKHGKTSVRVRKTSVRVQCTNYQNTHTLQIPHKHTHVCMYVCMYLQSREETLVEQVEDGYINAC